MLEHIDIQEDEPLSRSESLEAVQEEEGLDGHVAQRGEAWVLHRWVRALCQDVSACLARTKA